MKNTTGAILAIVFISYLGFSLPYPILPSLFLNSDSTLLTGDWTEAGRSLMLALVFATYSLGQFIGSTLIGHFSDHHGRKKMLFLALFGSVSGYLICAYAIATSELLIFFFGRTLMGFCEASAGIAQAIASDVSINDARIRKFGYINTAASTGWLLGPLIGGFLSEISLFGIEGQVMLFLIPALLGTLMLFYIAYVFEETYFPDPSTKSNGFKIITSFNELRTRPEFPRLKVLLGANFSLVMGFSCLQYFFPSFLIEKFNADPQDIGIMWSVVSLAWVIAQIVITSPLSRVLSPVRAFTISAFFMSLTYLLVSMTENYTLLICELPLIGIASAVAFTNAIGFVSNSIDASYQGRILGINRSVHSLGRATPTLLAGYLAGIDVALPIVAGSAFVAIAFLLPQLTTEPEKAVEAEPS